MLEESETAPMSTLPDDLIVEHILPRLAVKPLTRFKTVSKSWLSVISSPHFAKSHSKLFSSSSRSHSQTPQFLLFSGNRAHPLFTWITFDEDGRVSEIAKLNYTYNGGKIHVVGTCNGLVCFTDKHFNFRICNPVTRQCSDIITISGLDTCHYVLITAGFGYVSSIDDYKIVCLMRLPDRNDDIELAKVYIFSLRNWEWEELSSTTAFDSAAVAISRADVPVLINDTLYWSATNICRIVGVNLVDGGISIIPLSGIDVFSLGPDQPEYFFLRVKLFGIKGQLSLCCDHKVWMLNPDGLSWMKLYDLNIDAMRLLCVSESGKWLVLNHDLLALLNPNKRFLRQYEGGTSYVAHIFSAWDYKMTLFSPFLE